MCSLTGTRCLFRDAHEHITYSECSNRKNVHWLLHFSVFVCSSITWMNWGLSTLRRRLTTRHDFKGMLMLYYLHRLGWESGCSYTTSKWCVLLSLCSCDIDWWELLCIGFSGLGVCLASIRSSWLFIFNSIFKALHCGSSCLDLG